MWHEGQEVGVRPGKDTESFGKIEDFDGKFHLQITRHIDIVDYVAAHLKRFKHIRNLDLQLFLARSLWAGYRSYRAKVYQNHPHRGNWAAFEGFVAGLVRACPRLKKVTVHVEVLEGSIIL